MPLWRLVFLGLFREESEVGRNRLMFALRGP